MPPTSRMPSIDIVFQELIDCKVDKTWIERKEADSYLEDSEGQDEKHQAGKKGKLLSNKTVQARKHEDNQVKTITSPNPRNGSASLRRNSFSEPNHTQYKNFHTKKNPEMEHLQKISLTV
ncbi:hypothetical protein A4A49_07327 [Nicotiana attenuata]|uniref:Uncharacterized protein n=1 Tax=Nicotiana attenuata TaxID=49451 RepID=A0A1J6I4A3_NICAT|nr:hypothetical protein A4A49_07327 [Nicotiana attenuata]